MRNYDLGEAERDLLQATENILYVTRQDGLEGRLNCFQTMVLRSLSPIRIALVDYDPEPHRSRYTIYLSLRNAA